MTKIKDRGVARLAALLVVVMFLLAGLMTPVFLSMHQTVCEIYIIKIDGDLVYADGEDDTMILSTADKWYIDPDKSLSSLHYEDLEEGQSYLVLLSGYRIPLFNMYPTILRSQQL